MARVRIDTLLSERGMFPSRSRAAASVLAGDVLVLPERRRVAKPGELVADDVELEVLAREHDLLCPAAPGHISEPPTTDLGEFERMMSNPAGSADDQKQFEELMKGYHDLVDHGKREIYKIEG